MELIIKIPDEAYEQLKSKPTLDNIAESIIANGTPLPKGHGRLIDARVLKDKVVSWLKPEKPDKTKMISLDNALISTIMEIEESETIVEADKENSGKGKTTFFCSECGREIDTKPFTRPDKFPFCHCGADMRKGAKNECDCK